MWWTREESVLRSLLKAWGQFIWDGGTVWVERSELDPWVLCGGWTFDNHLVNEWEESGVLLPGR